MESNKKNIWVVSDEQVVTFISTLLPHYNVMGFANPTALDSALKKVRSAAEAPSLIISDNTNEKKGDGIQVLNSAKDFRIPVIIQSGDDYIKDQMIENGAAYFIKKPYSNSEFISKVEAVIETTAKKPVWIVNNNPALSNKMKEVLGDQKYNFVVIDDAKAAIELLKRVAGNDDAKKPLIIADINTLDGMSVVKMANKIGGFRVIIESNSNAESVAKSNGAMEFILRSEINRLDEVVDEVLKRPAPSPSKGMAMSK
mgnify:CR=1 FL=1